MKHEITLKNKVLKYQFFPLLLGIFPLDNFPDGSAAVSLTAYSGAARVVSLFRNITHN